MLFKTLRKKWPLLFLCIVISLSAVAGAQESQKRIPGQVLPSQFSGILLMDSRITREPPDKIIQFMGLKDGDIIADIGCGNGFFALPVAKAIEPDGIVYAEDIQQGMLDQLVKRAQEAKVSNIKTVLGTFDDPLLPKGKIDWILLVDVYHEFSDPEPMLARMKECLAPGGRVALVEYRGEQSGRGMGSFPIPRDHSMTVKQVMSEWLPAGFESVTTVEFLPIQHLFVFKNGDDKLRPAIRKLAIKNVENVSTFDYRYFFSGQPDKDALKQFAGYGIKTVINLRTDKEITDLGFDAKAVIEEAGMTYVHTPMGFEIPDESTRQKITDALDTAAVAPVLIYCGNANRVGAIWSLYAAKKDKLTADEAIAEGKTIGITLPELEKAAREALAKQ